MTESSDILKIEAIFLDKSHKERYELIDEISKAFATKLFNAKKITEVLKMKEIFLRVRIRLERNILLLKSFKENKIAKEMIAVFEKEYELLDEIQTEFLKKAESLTSVDVIWMASNLNKDKLVALTSELMAQKVMERVIGRKLGTEIYAEEVGKTA